MRQYTGLGMLTVSALLLSAGCASQQAAPVSYPVQAPAAAPSAASEEAPMASEAKSLRQDAPLRYVVKKGDTLWDISQKFLADAWEWPEIWTVNGQQVANPHLIYPGDVLTLFGVKGKRKIEADSAVRAGLEKVSPQVRSSGLSDAIPAIPIEAIRDFLQSPRVVTAEQLKRAPYVVDFVDPQLVAGADERAYVKNLPTGETFAYSLVRLGKELKDPDTGRVLAWEAIPVGDAEVKDFSNGRDVGQVNLIRTVREVRKGDYLIEQEAESYDPYFYPKAPNGDANARIISVLDGFSQIGQYAIVTLSRGTNTGLARGDVLTAMQTGRTARDPHVRNSSRDAIRLPDEPSGDLMIFKATPEVSFALVMGATRAIHQNDRAVNPITLR